MASAANVVVKIQPADRCYVCDDPRGYFVCVVFAANHDAARKMLIEKLHITYQTYAHITPLMLEEIPMSGARLLRSSD